MLEQIAKKLASAMMAGVSVPDVETFNDPVALEVPWRPLPKNNSRTRSHELTDDGAGKLKFTRSTWSYLIALAIVGACLGYPTYSLITTGHAAVGCLPFSLIALVFVWPSKREFDRNEQQITLGKNSWPFSAVHALQLFGHYVSGDEGRGYTSYQLNLVMKDRSRVNLVDHGNLDGVREDAQKLARHLGVKLWDGPAAPQLAGGSAP